jgi:magnesium transporter
MALSQYLHYFLNPLDLLRTQKVLHVNPTVEAKRTEPRPSVVTVYDYNTESCNCSKLQTVQESFAYIETPTISWINIDHLNKPEVEAICNRYGIHNLIAEDILSVGQRPKTDEINGLLFCLLNMLYFDDATNSVETEQVSIVLGKDFVISFQEDATRDVFTSVRERLQVAGSKVRLHNADFLFYALIDAIVDHYFLVMDKLGDKIELLEEDIIRNANARSVSKINAIRKEMIILKRSVAPVREMVGTVLRSEHPLLEDRTEKYFKDVYDHIIQANDLLENYRDMIMNLNDLYLSNVNLKMNEVMKVMAIVTCLLAPATVIGGIFGMNFDVIPLAHKKWGFYGCVALMFLIPFFMIKAFKKRGWF